MAFVDDVAIVLHSSKLADTLVTLDAFLKSMGLVLNQKKSELLPTRPMAPILNSPCPVVDYAMHLGHPIPNMCSENQACALIVAE